MKLSAMMRHQKAGRVRLARIDEHLLQRRHGLFISSEATIGKGLKLPHPTGIVIGAGVRLGGDVTIYQNVTLGGARLGDQKIGDYPTIGDGTVLFAGAVLVGGITVGRNCVIGANSVVTDNIPDNSTAVGAPARIIHVTLP